MIAVATTHPRATVLDRLRAALPLATIYLWLSIIYCVEAWKRATPWLFTDELEFTQLSRSIAATGRAARRGEPHSFRSLYVVMTAPIWLIHDVSTAFATVKYVDTLVMTAVLFPTYFLARLVVGRVPALFAAAGAALVPALAYSSWIVEETLAYPYAALCFLVFAKAFMKRSRAWIVGAVALSAIAPAVKSELLVIPVTLALTLLFMWASSDRMQRRYTSWSLGDWLGVVALFFGAVYLISGFLSNQQHDWYAVTTYYKHRIFTFGDWATGSLAIGLGVLPLVLGLAAIAPVRGEARTPGLRVFRSLALAGVFTFWLYTAIKAAYLSTVFASRVEERNLIYIAPLLFVGTALVLERRRVNPWALGGAAAYTLYVALGTPLFIGGGLYSDALGLAIFQQANRYLLLGNLHAKYTIAFIFLVGMVLTVLSIRLRSRAAAVLPVLAGIGILAWNATAEIAAAAGDITISRDIRPTIGEPFTWVDDNTHLKPTLYLGQQVGDQNPEWLLEFWNRSITTVSSLDGTVGGPGPAGAPNVTTRGQLYWTLSPSDPGKIFDYAVEELPCVNFAGTVVKTHPYRGGVWRLVRLTKPNRLAALCDGIYGDGWSGANDSRYFRFFAKRAGWLRITLARPAFAGSPVDVQVATIVRQHNQPVAGRVTEQVVARIPPDGRRVMWVRTPASPFVATAVIRDKFIPSKLNPNSGDVRTLGAKVEYRWFLTKGQ